MAQQDPEVSGPHPTDMQKRVYVHCGFHKTATSYLQRLLRLNTDVLAPVLQIQNRVELTTRDARLACTAFAKGKPGARAEAIVEGFRELGRLALERPDVPTLITDEELLGEQVGQGGEKAIYPRAHEMAPLILEGLQPFDAQLVIYTRDDEAWLRSVHNQAVKRHGYSGSLARLRAEAGPDASLGEVRARIETAVGPERVTFFRLEADRDHRWGTGGQLFEHMGLTEEDIAAIAPPAPVNESLDAWALNLLRGLNGLPLPEAPRQAARRLLLRGHGKLRKVRRGRVR